MKLFGFQNCNSHQDCPAENDTKENDKCGGGKYKHRLSAGIDLCFSIKI